MLASIACHDPVIFLEPKVLYRAAVEQVPTEAYEIPLSQAEIVKEGKDVTVVSYGQPMYLCSSAIAAAEKDLDISVELLDLRTLYPWDRKAVLESVQRTGRAIVVHESMINAGIGAEVAASIQEGAFLHLEAPVQRLGGFSTHMGLTYERFILPDVTRKSLFSCQTSRLTQGRDIRRDQTDRRILRSVFQQSSGKRSGGDLCFWKRNLVKLCL